MGARGLAGGLAAVLILAAPAAADPADPLGPVLRDALRDQYFPSAPILFDDRVRVRAPVEARRCPARLPASAKKATALPRTCTG